jgi:hypothetical protein
LECTGRGYFPLTKGGQALVAAGGLGIVWIIIIVVIVLAVLWFLFRGRATPWAIGGPSKGQ